MHEDDLTYSRRRLREESARTLATESRELEAYHGQLAQLYRARVERLSQAEAPQPMPPSAASAH